MKSQNQPNVHKQGSRAGVAAILLCLAMASPLAIAVQAPSQIPAQVPLQDQQSANPSVAPSQAAPAVQGTEPPKLSTDPVQRRKDQIAADTAQLDQLANELKVEMDKSTKDTLSLNVIKKAKEIEKLAHKLRDEISASLMN